MSLGSVLRDLWARVPHPRESSVVYTIAYAIALGTGLVTLALPPMSLAAKIGEFAMGSVGGLLVAGAVFGMFGGAYENRPLERLGLGLMAWALTIYFTIVTVLHFQGPGSRLTQGGVVLLALVAGCADRWFWLRRVERELKDLGG